MATITIDGMPYWVIESLGYQPSAGVMAKRVETPNGPRMAVKARGMGAWRFWTAEDRTAPLRDAVARGWKPGDAPSVTPQSEEPKA